MQYIANPIYSTGRVQSIVVKRAVYHKQTIFQKIGVFDTEDFGRCLVIDGVVQAAEHDHELYDSILTALIKKKHRRVLILGGGDGFVAEAALAKNPSLRITLVEIDQDVIDVASDYFNQTVFDDRRVELVISDATIYLNQIGRQQFDVIIFDLTDNPSSCENGLSVFSDFYSNAFKHAAMALGPDGLVAVQSGASLVADDFIDSVAVLREIMAHYFSNIREESVFIPSFGEKCSFLFAQKRCLTNR